MQYFQPADFYNLKVIESIALSPGGEKVVFCQREHDENSDKAIVNLWLLNLCNDRSSTPIRLTRGLWKDTSPQWNNEGSKLAFLSNRPSEPSFESHGDEQGKIDGSDEEEDVTKKNQIWVLDVIHGGEPKQITTNSEGVDSFHWAPGDEKIVFSGRDPTSEQRKYLKSKDPVVVNRLQHKFDGKGFLDNVRNHLFVVNMATLNVDRITDEDFDDHTPRWSPDGSEIAFVSNRTKNPDDNERDDLWVIKPDGTDLRSLTEGDVDASHPRWSPSGDHIAFIGSVEPENYYRLNHLMIVDRGGKERSIPTKGFDYGCFEVSYPIWSVDGEELYTVVGKEAQGRLIRTPAFSSGEVEVLFPTEHKFVHLEFFDVDDNCETAVFTLTSPRNPRNIFAASMIDLKGDPEDGFDMLTDLNREWLEDRKPYRTERFVVTGAEGDEVEFLVDLPPDFDGGPAPAVLWIHGGPMAFDYPGFYMRSAVLTATGYVVLHVNYHGSTSYGEKFTMSVHGDWGRREEEDFKACLNHLIEKGWIDPEKLFVGGGSMGGILTNWLMGRTDLFQAAVSERSECDYFSAFGTDDMHLWLVDDLGLPWENPAAFRKISPIRYVADMNTPVLFIEGQEDCRCDLSNTEQLYVSLKKRGVESELVIYPGEYHVFEQPAHLVDRLERTLDWFARHGGLEGG